METRINTSPRGSPRIRLISSFAMLALVIAGASFYSIRKTGELLEIGVDAHMRCAIEGTYPRQTQTSEMAAALGVPFTPVLQPVLDAAGADYSAVSAWRCNIAGRDYETIILRKGPTLVSVILTLHRDQEVFPPVLASRTTTVSGITLHENHREGYSVAAFESDTYLGYIVSALNSNQNGDLARRLAPVIARYTKCLKQSRALNKAAAKKCRETPLKAFPGQVPPDLSPPISRR